MSPKCLLSCIVLLGPSMTTIVGASAECDAASASLAQEVQGSATFTAEVATALANAMGACNDTALVGGDPHVRANTRLSQNDLLCGAGSVSGPGEMFVTFWTAATGPVTYQDVALITYQRHANHDESITARDGTNTGFDVTQKSGVVAGKAVVAGVPFDANDADVDGDCPGFGRPCNAFGYVAYAYSQIQAWIYGDILVCL